MCFSSPGRGPDRFTRRDEKGDDDIFFCNNAFAPCENMYVCREKKCSKEVGDIFECKRIPNCPPPRSRCFC